MSMWVRYRITGGSWISPEKETPQPPWAACSRAPSPSEGRSSSSCSGGTQYLHILWIWFPVLWKKIFTPQYQYETSTKGATVEKKKTTMHTYSQVAIDNTFNYHCLILLFVLLFYFCMDFTLLFQKFYLFSEYTRKRVASLFLMDF